MMVSKSLLAATVLTSGLAFSTTGFADWGHQSRMENRGRGDFTQASVDNLKGMRVQDRAGEEIGTVKDVMFDSRTGRIDYLILTSGTPGSEKEYAVRFDSLQFNPDGTVLTSSMDRSQLYGSPEYYGVSPSEKTAGEQVAVMRSDLEKLEGMRVEDQSGHDFGFVRSADFNTKTSAIDHLIVFSKTSAGEKHYLVPLGDVHYRPDKNAFQLTVGSDRLSTVALVTAPAEYYGVSPAQGESLSNVERSYVNQHAYGATLENKTGQPPSRWPLGSSDAGRNYPEGYQMGGTYWQVE